MTSRTLVLGALLSIGLGPACGEAGAKTAQVVEAASKSTAESLRKAVEELELDQLTPELAKAKVQEVIDLAARELAEVRDSAAVERVGQELQSVLDELSQLKQSIVPKLNLATLQKTILDLIERFKNDPHVQALLKSLHEKLQRFAR